MVKRQENLKNKNIQKIIFYFINLVLLLSFSLQPYSSDKNKRFSQELVRITNEKLNIILQIIFIIEENNSSYYSSTTFPTKQTENGNDNTHQNDPQNIPIKSLTKRSSFVDLSNFTDRKQPAIKSNLFCDLIDYQSLLDIIQEGVILIKAEIQDEPYSFNLKIEYQNQMSKNMFQQTNEELLTFFQNMPSEVLKDQSPMIHRSSVISQQSFVQKQYKKMKQSSRLTTSEYFLQQEFSRQDNQLFSGPSPRIRSSTAQCNTVYKTLIYLIHTRKFRYEINGKTEGIIIEATLEQHNSSNRQIEIILTILNDNTIVIVSRDVVHRQNITSLLQINQSKSKILSHVSHEFRSPLNVIINILCSLKQKLTNNSEIHQNISILLENAYYMLNLSNDLLDLAQIKVDCFKLIKSEFNIIDLGMECLQMFKLQAQKKKIQLTLFANTKPLYVFSDRNRLKQILINLLANSMKFTVEGEIQLKFLQKNLSVQVGVSDTGIGISPEDQAKLFKAFGRIINNENEKLNNSGVGLGLLISSKIASQLTSDHSGLKIKSKDSTYQDHGSFFYFTLEVKMFHQKNVSYKPKEIEPQRDIPKNQNENEQSQFYMNELAISFNSEFKFNDKNECHHLLIVDDNIFNLNILEIQIKQFTNSDIDKSNNGREAIECVKRKFCSKGCIGYSAIFMDLEMPLMNGFEASQEILKNHENILIFIVSGYEDQLTKSEGQKIGIKEFIVKPFSKDKIQQIVLEYHL